MLRMCPHCLPHCLHEAAIVDGTLSADVSDVVVENVKGRGENHTHEIGIGAGEGGNGFETVIREGYQIGGAGEAPNIGIQKVTVIEREGL